MAAPPPVATAAPDAQLLLRSPAGLRTCAVARGGGESRTPSIAVGVLLPGVKKASYSADGLVIATITDTVRVNDIVIPSDAPLPMTCELSAAGRFLVTFSRPDLTQIFACDTGSMVFSLKHKKPRLQIAQDEKSCVHLTANEVRVISTETWEPLRRIHIDGVENVSACPVNTSIFAAFVPEGRSGKPANVSIYVEGECVASYASFRAEEATFKWASDGSACLCKLETTMDATGQSYYGESRLVLLSRDKPYVEVATKEGAVHDFAWSPTSTWGRLFCVSAGKSPPQCMLYDGQTGQPVFDFGNVHRNTIAFSPQGRFLCLAGFGNLAGDMDFWDVKRKKKLGSGKADAAVGYGWSPDGKLFMTSTLAPRMNVDNLVALYSCRGAKLAEWRADGPVLGPEKVLYECTWRPQPHGHPDEAPSPRGAEAVEAPPVEAPKVYRPAHASGVVAEMMRQGRSAPTKAVAVPGSVPVASAPAVVKSAGRPNNNSFIPGLDPKVANANKAAKAAKAAKKDAPPGVAKAAAPSAEASKPKSDATPAAKSAVAPAAAAATPADAAKVNEEGAGDGEEDVDKMLRRVRKLLRQIAEIEQKGVVNDDQRAKIARKAALEQEEKELVARQEAQKLQDGGGGGN